MAAPERADRPTWQVLVALAGAATSIVIFVYLVGGAIVWERLHVLRLPANQAVTPLPRNLVLIVGVRALAWPVVLGLVAAGLVKLLTHILRSGVRGTRVICALLIVVWIASLVALGIYSTVQKVVFLTALGILVAVAVAAARRQLVGVRRLALATSVAMVAVGVVVEAVDIYQLPVRMEYAHVRLAGGTEMKGFYIGATSDAVYLAPNLSCHVLGRIVALPQREIAQVDVFTSTKAWPQNSYPAVCQSPP
jgi:hypothetical protein